LSDGWVRYKDAGRDGLSHDEEHATSALVNLHILFTHGLVGRGSDAVQVLEMAEALQSLGYTVRLVCHRDACWKSYDSEKRDATENDGICTRSQRDQEKDVEEHFAPGWLHCRRVHQPGMRHG